MQNEKNESFVSLSAFAFPTLPDFIKSSTTSSQKFNTVFLLGFLQMKLNSEMYFILFRIKLN